MKPDCDVSVPDKCRRPVCSVFSLLSLLGCAWGVFIIITNPSESRGPFEWGITFAQIIGAAIYLVSSLMGFLLALASLLKKEKYGLLSVFALILHLAPFLCILIAFG